MKKEKTQLSEKKLVGISTRANNAQLFEADPSTKKVVFLFVVLSFCCQISNSIACLPVGVLQEQYKNHLNVKYLAWDGGVERYQKAHGLPSRNGYYLLGFRYNTWEIMPDKKPMMDVFSLSDAKNKAREGLATLSGDIFMGFAPADGSKTGRAPGRVMKCNYKLNINGDVHTIETEGWQKS